MAHRLVVCLYQFRNRCPHLVEYQTLQWVFLNNLHISDGPPALRVGRSKHHQTAGTRRRSQMRDARIIANEAA